MTNAPWTHELEEASRRYARLLDVVSDYHYHVRVEAGCGLKKVHGPKCELVTGYRPDEYAANPQLWLDIVLDEDRPTIERQTAQALAGQLAAPIEYRIRRKDGQVRWMLKTIVPYHDPQGRLIAYDSLLRDITDAKQAVESVRQSEERFRLLFEDDLTGDYVANSDGTILLCNAAFVNIFGFSSRAEAIGSNLAQLYIAPLSWPRFIQMLKENKSLERYERAVRHSDGSIRHVIETAVATFDSQGELLRIKGYVFDDTHSKLAATRLQRRNAELEEIVSQRTQALREKHEHLRAIWNSAFDAIITIDRDGLIESTNQAAEKMFGYASAEMLGQNVKMLMPSPFREEHDHYLRQYRDTGQPRILNTPRELLACRKDGSTFPIELSVTQVDGSHYFTGIICDISERKELQLHVLQIAEDEQRRLGLELHDGIGQELTGLSLVAGTLLNLVNAIPTKETRDECVRQLDEASFVRLRDITQKLSHNLTAANRHVQQLSHGIMPVQVDPQALRSALEELASSTTSQSVRCWFDCPTPAISVKNGDATHLYRIAQEAVNNALRHSQADTICIALQQHKDQIILEVRDNGIGIQEVDNRTVMPSKRRGMGLRTMQYRAGMIGGTLQVERLPTGGTVVRCVALCGRY